MLAIILIVTINASYVFNLAGYANLPLSAHHVALIPKENNSILEYMTLTIG